MSTEPILVREPIRDNSNRAEVTIILFYALGATLVVSIVSSYFQLLLLNDLRVLDVSDAEINANDFRETVVAVFFTLAQIALVVCFLMWFRRFCGNVIRSGANTSFSETRAVWSFFIPIISLYRPYQIAKEAFDRLAYIIAFADPHYVSTVSAKLIRFWWVAFVLGSLLSNASARIATSAATLESMSTATKVSIFSDIVLIAAAFLAVRLIRSASRDERFIYEHQHLETSASEW